MAQEVVIVDGDGNEHIFPEGFDPKRAASIVRGQKSGVPNVSSLDMVSGRVGRDSGSSDGPSPAGDWKSKLAGAMESMAHPQTVSDFGNILLAPVDATRGAAALAASNMGRSAIGGTLSTVGSAIDRTGSALPELPTAAIGYATGGRMGAAIGAAVPRGLQLLGKMINKAGSWISPAVEEAAPAAVSPHLDLSQMARPGAMTQAQIGERLAAVDAAGGLPTQAPVAAKPMVSVTQQPTAVPNVSLRDQGVAAMQQGFDRAGGRTALQNLTVKPSFSANDVVRIKVLMQSGLSENEAVAKVMAGK